MTGYAATTADETDHERDKQLTASRRTRAKNTSAEAKLASWGDVPNQTDIFEQLAEVGE